MKISQGIYEHYKSTTKNPKYYQVLFLSHLEETGETLVHYQPLYWEASNDNAVFEDGITIWTRTLANFCEEVDYEDKMVKRFKRIK